MSTVDTNQLNFSKVNCRCGQAAPYYFPWVNVILQFSSRPLRIVVSSFKLRMFDSTKISWNLCPFCC